MKMTCGKRITSALLVLVMLLSVIAAVPFASAAELPPEGSWARNVLDNCEYALDLGSWSTAAADGGAGHLQGFVCDDEQKYMYASFTNMLVKVDMRTGEIVGTVTGMAAGSISSGAHIGDIAYYDGKIYGSLEYKASERWYICVFDGDAITGDMHYTDPGVMYGLYVPEVGDDFKNNLYRGEHYNNASSYGHRYGTGGIDGITFGTLPGKGYDTDGDGDVDVSTGDKQYMLVTYGPYGNAARYDNENFVFLVYDPENITEQNLLPFTEELLTKDYTEEQKLFYEHKLFCYAGNQTYGVQQLEFDVDTGDLLLECYGRPSGTEFPGYSRYVVDGSVPMYLDTVEVGQSVTGDKSGFVTQEEALATAALYTDYEDADGDGNTTEQETGWHMTLKCICGKGGMDQHEAAVYGATGYACKVCGGSAQFATGLKSLGNDYFYGASSGSETVNGKSHQWGEAYLYKLDRTGAYSYSKVTEPAKLLMSYTMDAADTYEKDGQVYLKDVSGNGYDALVEGTYAAAGADGTAAAALGFRGDLGGTVLDRVHMTDEAMAYINEEVEDSFSYSFWLYNDVEMDRFTPIIGMYRDEDVQKNLYAGVFEWRYRNSPAVIVHKNTQNPWYGKNVSGETYLVKPATDGGDGSSYIHGNGSASGLMDTWRHYVVVRSGSTVTVYYNGQATQSAGANIGNNNLENLSAFEIGGYLARNWVDTNVRCRFTGIIDDVKIYAGELNQADAKALYEAGAAKSTATGAGAVAASGEPVFGSYTGEVLAEQTDPILHYRMDETGTVTDVSGNGKNAIATEAVTTVENESGQADSALYFDGRSSVNPTKVTLSADDTAWLSKQINATGKMTISFWMNADMENSHRMSLLGVYDKTGRPMGTFETRGTLGQDLWMDGRFAIAFTAAKKYDSSLNSGVIDEKTYEQKAITATTPTYDNEFDNRGDKHYGDKLIDAWYHVVGELDETANTLSLYVDGQLVQTVSMADGTLDEIGYFMIGAPGTRYYQYENSASTSENSKARQGWAMRDGYLGAIDDVQVYNRILSADEVKAIYEAGTIYDELVSVGAVSPTTVYTTSGTAQADILLPGTVSLVTTKNTYTTGTVTWDWSGIDANPTKDFTLTGAVTLPAGLENPNNIDLTTSVQVKVVTPVTGVALDQKTAEVKAGKTLVLTAVVSPEDATSTAVTWSSSDEEIAAVNAAGVVTGVASGKVTITVTTREGGFTDTCVVTVLPRADKTALQAAVTDAKALTESAYTTASWHDVEDAVDVAEAVLDDENAEQAAVDAAKAALESAVKHLVKRGDKTDLIDLIDEIGKLNASDYTEATWKALQAELVDANAVKADIDAVQTDIDPAVQALAAAKSNLVSTVALQSVIADAETLQKRYYTTDSWNNLEAALAAAKTVLADADAGKTELANAADALEKAIGELVARGDKTALVALIKEAEGLGESKYTEESWNALLEEIAEAKKVVDDVDATAADVSKAVSDLLDAIEALKQKGLSHDEPKVPAYVPVTDEEKTPVFTDVGVNDWFYDDVYECVGYGLFNGTSATTFSPKASMNRAMVWTVLARMDGVDTTGGSTWYAKGREWAMAEGISDGTNPTANVTREQLVTMLYRYEGSPAHSGAELTFADAADVSGWALDAVTWAVEEGLLNGKTGNKLDPQGNATRAEVAAILVRLLNQ